MVRRVFIAINLPQEIKQELLEIQKRFPTLPCRWIKSESLHLTLAFLGNLNDEEILKVIEAVKETADQRQSFSFFLNKICYGPGKKMPPRLVWIEGQKSKELAEIKNKLDNLLTENINYKPDKRDFLPHITLARVKTFNWRRLGPEQRLEVDLTVDLEIPVNSIQVMESQLKRTGAEYKIIQSIGL